MSNEHKPADTIYVTDHKGQKISYPKVEVTKIETIPPDTVGEPTRIPIADRGNAKVSGGATDKNGKVELGPISYTDTHGENSHAEKLPPQE